MNALGEKMCLVKIRASSSDKVVKVQIALSISCAAAALDSVKSLSLFSQSLLHSSSCQRKITQGKESFASIGSNTLSLGVYGYVYLNSRNSGSSSPSSEMTTAGVRLDAKPYINGLGWRGE